MLRGREYLVKQGSAIFRKKNFRQRHGFSMRNHGNMLVHMVWGGKTFVNFCNDCETSSFAQHLKLRVMLNLFQHLLILGLHFE